MSQQTITAVILTKNEENNIGKCLSSLGWCDEILIIDDYSKDDTVGMVKRKAESGKTNNIKIYQRKLNADFAAQRNFGLEKATSDWILFVDADEIISDKLASEIKLQITNDKLQISGFYIKRKDYYGGRWLKYGETANVKLLRLAQKDAGMWEGRVHEVWRVEGQTGNLQNPILHYPHQTVSEFLKEVNWYTDIVAQYWKEQGRQIGWWQILFYPPGKFLDNYIVKQGFRDGMAGFVVAIFMSFHSFLARGKYWQATPK